MIEIQTINNRMPMQDSIRVASDEIVNRREDVVIQKTMSNSDTLIEKRGL